MTVLVIAAVAIVGGALLQRLSGTGVGLVVAPTLSVLLGPTTGVLVTNATTTVSGFLIMLTVLQHVEWRRFAWIIAAAAPGAVAGAYLVHALPVAWLQVVIGAVVLLALATSLALPDLPTVRGRAPIVVAGAIGGLFNTTAGVAAPAMVIYARLARWDQRAFAATLQPTFMSMGAMSVVLKTAMSPTGLAGLPPWWGLPIVVALVLAGVGLGTLAARRVTSHHARTLALVLAGIGGAVVLGKGLWALV
ncbi:TSUP family transporter [Mariniluteicoccus flavus]